MDETTLRQLFESEDIEPAKMMLKPSFDGRISTVLLTENLAKDCDCDEPSSSTLALITYGVSTGHDKLKAWGIQIYVAINA